MLVLLTREFGYVNEIPQHNISNLKCTNEILAVMDYINQNIDTNITLEHLSRVGNLSPNYLCSAFKQMNGMTVWEYILIRRIDEAKKRLKEGNESILNIQLACGFRTTSNFNKAFKKQVGMTPSEYKKHLNPQKT